MLLLLLRASRFWFFRFSRHLTHRRCCFWITRVAGLHLNLCSPLHRLKVLLTASLFVFYTIYRSSGNERLSIGSRVLSG